MDGHLEGRKTGNLRTGGPTKKFRETALPSLASLPHKLDLRYKQSLNMLLQIKQLEILLITACFMIKLISLKLCGEYLY